jgi:hypothetical protein
MKVGMNVDQAEAVRACTTIASEALIFNSLAAVTNGCAPDRDRFDVPYPSQRYHAMRGHLRICADPLAETFSASLRGDRAEADSGSRNP